MIKSEEYEFITVRVQDPRVVNEGSWSAFVDYKIFLHTNSKAFTAKTSCVRRRYREFVWLKKTLQRNAGLVPVPDLPGKSFFTFYNTDLIEKRRMGLQSFLEKVLHMTVCLSDSQLHLFLQTQLPVGHIRDCVNGHTPFSVTDAILTYASSNRGWAQEEGSGLLCASPISVSYESTESPSVTIPSIQYEFAPDEPETDATDLNSVQLRVCEEDVAIREEAFQDSRKRRLQNGEVRELVVEVHQHVPFMETENTTEDADLSLADKRAQTQTHYNTEDLSAPGDTDLHIKPVEDEPQTKHMPSNNNWVDFVI